jgi:hypothetical protein
MSKFVWVGENYDNVHGASSKGYCLRRQGKAVIVKYDPVEVIGGRGGKFFLVGKGTKSRKKAVSDCKGCDKIHERKRDCSRKKGI